MSRHRVLILDRDPDLYRDAVRERFADASVAGCESYEGLSVSLGELRPTIVLASKVGSEPFPREQLYASPKLEWIQCTSAGVDHLLPGRSDVHLTSASGIHDEALSDYVLCAALSFNLAGYAAEIVRGGVGALEKGQTEAAKSIGMTREKILVYILLPQAARQMVPPFTNETITMIKSSSLLSVISVYELTRSGQAIISVHFVPFEIYGMLALYYWVMITFFSWLTRQLERRLPVW